MEGIFKGTYYAVLDSKHRIKFPDEFVGVLTEYYAAIWKDKSINIVSKKAVTDSLKLVKENVNIKEPQKMGLIREIASAIYIIELDEEGRYELPLPLLHHTGFKEGDTVSIVGKDDRLEIALKK